MTKPSYTKETLSMYGQDIQVYTISKGRAVNVHFEGLSPYPEKTMFMKNGTLLESDERLRGSFYAEGYKEDYSFVVLAENVDEKQLGNIFISLGVTEASHIAIELDKVMLESTDAEIEERQTSEAQSELVTSLSQAVEKKEQAKRAPRKRNTKKKNDEA